jgi:hypothetical protein
MESTLHEIFPADGAWSFAPFYFRFVGPLYMTPILNAREVAERHLTYAPTHMYLLQSILCGMPCICLAKTSQFTIPDERIHDPEVKELLDIASPNLG